MKLEIWLKNYSTVLMVLMVFVAFFLRSYQVNTIPPALAWDEVSIGYNAWSIYKTARDEHGRFLPLDTFIAYGDYKPPLAIYLTVPFVAVLGLNETAVRLPVVLLSTVTILVTYLLVLQLFRNNPRRYQLAMLSGLLLTLSPWHINLSRAGFEAVIALFLVVWGILWSLSAKPGSIKSLFQWLPFVLAIYTFNSARYFLPLLGPIILLYRYWDSRLLLQSKRRNILNNISRRQILIFAGSFVVAVILLMPILPHLTSPEARLRFKEVNIFSDGGVVETANQRIATAGNTALAKLVYNRRIGYTLSYLKHYLDHFDPDFLFIKGDGNPKFSTQHTGQLFVIESIFLVLGCYWIFRKHKRIGIFLASWLLLAIVPAGVARETPHALRILNTLPVWQIVIAFGIVSLTSVIRSKKILWGLLVGIVLTYSFSLAYYLHNYYDHYAVEYSGEWQYGYKQALSVTEPIKDNYDQIIMTDLIGRPYMYALFYGSYDPQQFWSSKQSYFDAAGFYKVTSFGKYRFQNGIISDVPGKTLYIQAPETMPEGSKILSQIRLLNGREVLRVFE